MVERHTIETYGPQPNNRNIWSTATESQTIETYGRHAWPILLSVVVAPFVPLLASFFFPSHSALLLDTPLGYERDII